MLSAKDRAFYILYFQGTGTCAAILSVVVVPFVRLLVCVSREYKTKIITKAFALEI
jgi:hypothetical protein